MMTTRCMAAQCLGANLTAEAGGQPASDRSNARGGVVSRRCRGRTARCRALTVSETMAETPAASSRRSAARPPPGRAAFTVAISLPAGAAERDQRRQLAHLEADHNVEEQHQPIRSSPAERPAPQRRRPAPSRRRDKAQTHAIRRETSDRTARTVRPARRSRRERRRRLSASSTLDAAVPGRLVDRIGGHARRSGRTATPSIRPASPS